MYKKRNPLNVSPKSDNNTTSACVSLTEPTPVARHDQRAEASTDDALRPPQRWLLEGSRVLVQKGVDAVGGRRTSIPHDGLCGGRQKHFLSGEKIILTVQHSSSDWSQPWLTVTGSALFVPVSISAKHTWLKVFSNNPGVVVRIFSVPLGNCKEPKGGPTVH